MSYSRFREPSAIYDDHSSPALLSDSDGGRFYPRRYMPAAQIMQELTERGCEDLTSDIDPDTCRSLPYAMGGYSDVFEAFLRDGTKVVIKPLRIRGELDGTDDERQRVKLAARDLHCWYKLNHHNVVQLLGFAYARGGLDMVAEWSEHGNILRYLRWNPNADRIELCTDIAAGLSYIHDRDVIHGDLKALNVMVSQRGRAMITGFGSVMLSSLRLESPRARQERGTTPRWMAPELFRDINPEVTRAMDVYAYGLTAFQVLTGEPPYADTGDSLVRNMILAHKPPYSSVLTNFATRELSSIAKKCWDPIPGRRPTMANVLESLLDLVQRLARNGQDSGQRFHRSRSSMTGGLEAKQQNRYSEEQHASDSLDSIYVGLSAMSLNSAPERKPLDNLDVNTQSRDQRLFERSPSPETARRRRGQLGSRDSAQSSSRRAHIRDADQRESFNYRARSKYWDGEGEPPSSSNSRSSAPVPYENTRDQEDKKEGREDRWNETQTTREVGYGPPRRRDEDGWEEPKYQRYESPPHGDQQNGRQNSYQQSGYQQSGYQQYEYSSDTSTSDGDWEESQGTSSFDGDDDQTSTLDDEDTDQASLLLQAAFLGRLYRTR